MSENNEDDDKTKISLTQEELEALIAEKTSENLADIKKKLDNAYQVRDQAKSQLDALEKEREQLEKEKREAELQRLKDEGKHKELYELQLAELKKNNEAEAALRKELEQKNSDLQKQSTYLQRDLLLRNALSGYNFKSTKAYDLAILEISKDLVLNEENVWVSKTGESLSLFAKAFAEDEENAFLLKAPASSGSTAGNVNSRGNTSKSIFQMKQSELLDKIAKGEIKR